MEPLLPSPVETPHEFQVFVTPDLLRNSPGLYVANGWARACPAFGGDGPVGP